jgi:hypothetical protein
MSLCSPARDRLAFEDLSLGSVGVQPRKGNHLAQKSHGNVWVTGTVVVSPSSFGAGDCPDKESDHYSKIPTSGSSSHHNPRRSRRTRPPDRAEIYGDLDAQQNNFSVALLVWVDLAVPLLDIVFLTNCRHLCNMQSRNLTQHGSTFECYLYTFPGFVFQMALFVEILDWMGNFKFFGDF